MMIDIKYLRHHPKLVFQMGCGLSIYESEFAGIDGRGVIGGPPKSFEEVHQKFYDTLFNQHSSTHDSPRTSYLSIPSPIGFKEDEFDIDTSSC